MLWRVLIWSLGIQWLQKSKQLSGEGRYLEFPVKQHTALTRRVILWSYIQYTIEQKFSINFIKFFISYWVFVFFKLVYVDILRVYIQFFKKNRYTVDIYWNKILKNSYVGQWFFCIVITVILSIMRILIWYVRQ